MYPRLLQLGHLAIPTTAAFAAMAIVIGLLTARATARCLGLEPEKIWDIGIAAVLTALIAPRLILVFANWNDFRAHPLWLLGVMHVRSQSAAAGGIALAAAAAALLARLTHSPLRRSLDAFAPALALGFAVASVGNFFGGSAFGMPATLPWAVTYTRRLASLWYATPLGTPLHPVQVYAAILEIVFFGLIFVMIRTRQRWRLRDGEIAGAWFFLHGVATSLLSCLRGDLLPADFAMTQMIAAAMVLAGGLLWLL